MLLTTGVCLFSIVVRHLLLRIPGMRQRVFEPRVHEGTEAERRRQSGADELGALLGQRVSAAVPRSDRSEARDSTSLASFHF